MEILVLAVGNLPVELHFVGLIIVLLTIISSFTVEIGVVLNVQLHGVGLAVAGKMENSFIPISIIWLPFYR